MHRSGCHKSQKRDCTESAWTVEKKRSLHYRTLDNALGCYSQIRFDLVQTREEIIAAGPLGQILVEFGLGIQIARCPKNLIEQIARITVRQRNLDVFGQMIDQEIENFVLDGQTAHLL